MGFCEILTIVFIVLKVLGIISWSWWLVLLPEIIAILFYIVLIALNIGLQVKIAKKIDKDFKLWVTKNK